MIRVLLSLLIAAGSLPTLAQDYRREQRWADEIVPGVVVGDVVWLEAPNGRKFLALFTETARPKASVVLVHGIGVHPDHGVIGTLRASLADAGYTTLAIQMPVLDAEATPRDYQAVFPEAVARVRAGAAWIQSKAEAPVVLVSHSLGSAMSNAYYEQTPDASFVAWVCMGLGGPYAGMRNVRVPVLDVQGEKDLPSVLRADWRRRITVDSIPGARQVTIASADHFYTGREKELVRVIDEFLTEKALK